MANTFTPTDVYAIVNAMAAEMGGSVQTASVIDTSSFVTAGEKMLATSATNTLNALSVVLGRTIVSARPYQGKFKIIMKTPAEWGGIERKISFYSTKLEPSTDFNTDLTPAQLVDGASIDPWKISKVYPLELSFVGLKVEQYTYTTWLHQLKTAFQSEGQFSEFIRGMLVNIANDLEVKEDAENRLQVLNAIGATINTGNARQAVNLTAAYNAAKGTSYTTQQLTTTYLKEFVAFFVARVKGDMELARENNTLFHIYPARNDDSGNPLELRRHTSPDMRRLLLYMPFIRSAETEVFPSLFSTSEVKLENYEGVEYWQNPNEPSEINVTPNQLNAATGAAVTGATVNKSMILGVFFDRDALATSVKLQDVYTSPINNRGAYYNTTYHWGFNFKYDATENMIVYYCED